MKKQFSKHTSCVLLMTLSMLTLSACGQEQKNPVTETTAITASVSDTQNDNTSASNTETDLAASDSEEITSTPVETASDLQGTLFTQAGPYGEISLTLLEDWEAEGIAMDERDEDVETNGLYGIKVFRSDDRTTFFSLFYNDNFGVCGTDLRQDTLTIAGCTAYAGYYGDCQGWSFISFADANEGLVVYPYSADDGDYYGDFRKILDTVHLDRTKRSGGAYFYTQESESLELGVQLSLENITEHSATIVLQQWDEFNSCENIFTGTYFSLEKLDENTDSWLSMEADSDQLCFTEEAYDIPKGTTLQMPVDWEQIYGKLEPGTYRLTKELTGEQDGGEQETYELQASFVWN